MGQAVAVGVAVGVAMGVAAGGCGTGGGHACACVPVCVHACAHGNFVIVSHCLSRTFCGFTAGFVAAAASAFGASASSSVLARVDHLCSGRPESGVMSMRGISGLQ